MRPSKNPSFVYRQDGYELSFEIVVVFYTHPIKMSRTEGGKNMETDSRTVSYRKHLQQQVNIGRQTLLGVIIMTLINLGLLLGNGGSYLLFSVFIPYYLTGLGKALDQMQNGTYTLTGLVIAVVILLVYFLFWVLSRKRGGILWLAVAGLGIDLLALIWISILRTGSILDNAVDILFHVVVIYQIGKGATKWKKLKDLPPEITYTVVTDDL